MLMSPVPPLLAMVPVTSGAENVRSVSAGGPMENNVRTPSSTRFVERKPFADCETSDSSIVCPAFKTNGAVMAEPALPEPNNCHVLVASLGSRQYTSPLTAVARLADDCPVSAMFKGSVGGDSRCRNVMLSAML